MIVETSPGHHHVYWLVDGLPLDQFEGVQRRIADTLGGDPVVDLPPVHAVAGHDPRERSG